MGKPHSTTSVVEVTVDCREGTFFIDMAIKMLSLRIHPTLIWAGNRVAFAHGPVVLDHVFVGRLILTAVVTAEGSFKAGFDLVSRDVATLEDCATVGTRFQQTHIQLAALLLWASHSSVAPVSPVHSQPSFLQGQRTGNSFKVCWDFLSGNAEISTTLQVRHDFLSVCTCLQVGMSPHGGPLKAVNITSMREFIRGKIESI